MEADRNGLESFVKHSLHTAQKLQEEAEVVEKEFGWMLHHMLWELRALDFEEAAERLRDVKCWATRQSSREAKLIRLAATQVVFGVSLPSALPGIAFGHDGKIKRAVRGGRI